jgi:hypothetical protein
VTRRAVREDVVIRPSFGTYRARLLVSVAVTTPLVVYQIWTGWQTGARYPLVIFWVLFYAVFGIFLVVFFRREEIVLAGGRLTRWNIVGMRKSYAIEDIGGMARRDVDFPLVARPTQYVIVYDKDHRCLFKMNRPFWDEEDIRRLHALLGGQSKVERVPWLMLADEFPGSVAWPVRHPFVLIAVEVVAIVALIVGIIVIQDALTHR